MPLAAPIFIGESRGDIDIPRLVETPFVVLEYEKAIKDLYLVNVMVVLTQPSRGIPPGIWSPEQVTWVKGRFILCVISIETIVAGYRSHEYATPVGELIRRQIMVNRSPVMTRPGAHPTIWTSRRMGAG